MLKKYYKHIILLIVSLMCVVFAYNDYFLYKTPILKVTEVNNTLDYKTDNGEEYYIQDIKGVIKNGKYKGRRLSATNNYSTSLVYEDKIEKGNSLLVELSDSGNSILNINSIKRDHYLVILLVIFIDLIVLVAGRKGVQTLISLLFNVAISLTAIFLYSNRHIKINLLLLYLIVSMIFVIGSLYITNGKSKKTLAAIISSIVSVFLSFGLSFLLIKLNIDKLYIWTLDYVEAINEFYYYLYVSILLCGLGAIMDIAITIASSLNELITKDPKIKTKALFKSGRVISKDVVGTMINVMLLTCYTSVIPTVVLALRNHMSFANALDFYGSLELTVVLCTCIGIVLAIPVSLYISIMILKGKKIGVRK